MRIESEAFSTCVSLKSLCLPSSVEFVGAECFYMCDSLSSLTFSLPSRIRALLNPPPGLNGLTEIPDSVEHLRVWASSRRGQRLAVHCDHESKLARIEIQLKRAGESVSTFRGFSAPILSIFRSQMACSYRRKTRYALRGQIQVGIAHGRVNGHLVEPSCAHDGEAVYTVLYLIADRLCPSR
jgi:hypothetical protein